MAAPLPRHDPFFPSGRQRFSSGGVFTNSTPVILADEMRFYYAGYNSGAIGGGANLTDDSQQSGVGFARLPLDRFAGIRTVAVSAQPTLKKPLEEIGQVTLKPLSLDGARSILLNADAAGGSVRVEILNEDGYRLRGFSRDDAEAVSGDGLRHSATWKERRLSDLPPGRYMLRLHLHRAEVFSVTIK